MKGWAVKWSSGPNNVDQKLQERLCLYDATIAARRGTTIMFFKSRAAARAYRDERYGYIKTRRDLRRYPHDWRLPRVVRATLEVKEINDD
jgi:hypothetical protein